MQIAQHLFNYFFIFFQLIDLQIATFLFVK